MNPYIYRNGMIEPNEHSPIVYSTNGGNIPQEVWDAYDRYLAKSKRAIATFGSHDDQTRAAWLKFIELCEKHRLPKNCMEK